MATIKRKIRVADIQMPETSGDIETLMEITESLTDPSDPLRPRHDILYEKLTGARGYQFTYPRDETMTDNIARRKKVKAYLDHLKFPITEREFRDVKAFILDNI